jgi:CBS domain-containing protein
MKIESVMTKNPVCCSPSDTVQRVAQMMKQQDVGAIPVVCDLVSKELIGIITDRDLCVSAIADGKEPHSTTIVSYYTKNVITCSPEDTLEVCEQKMKTHKVRRIPVVDSQNSCVGIIVQADIARVDRPESFQALITEISRPKMKPAAPIAAA